jgi:hypothetical protein
MAAESTSRLESDFRRYLDSFGDPNDLEALKRVKLKTYVDLMPRPGIPPRPLPGTDEILKYARRNLTLRERAMQWANDHTLTFIWIREHAMTISSVAVGAIAAAAALYVASYQR